MKLTKFGVGNFRSIGSSPVIIDMSDKITILAGANNSGKSNVLAAIKWLKDSPASTLNLLDSHNRDRTVPALIYAEGVIEEPEALALKDITSLTFRAQVNGNSGYTLEHNPIAHIRNLSEVKEIERTIDVAKGAALNLSSLRQDLNSLEMRLNRAAAQLLRNTLDGMPEVHMIPQFRRITSSQDYSLNGEGIIDLLQKWQIPAIGHEEESSRYQRINALLRRLLNLPDAELRVPQDKTIVIEREKIRLPLESYGTGIHQLIILAVAVFSVSDAIVCIEEPEIHLHPTLQRELLLFLRQETTNRYVITTHSPALLQPYPDVGVIHLRMEEGITVAHRVETTAHTLDVLRDLGIRASDLLQANSVLWVEGPRGHLINR